MRTNRLSLPSLLQILACTLLIVSTLVAQTPNEPRASGEPIDRSVNSRTIRDAEVYRVYGSVVNELTRYAIGKSSGVVILRTTVPVSRECFPKEKETKYREAFQDFLEQNSEMKVLVRKFKLKHRYELVTQEQIDSFGIPGEAFRKQFPHARGIVDFSAIGFSPSKTLALVRGRIYCGPLCGMARDYVLQKRGVNWHVVSAQTCGGES